MAGFTKLFNSILYSTIWQEPNETRLLWITMLAMSDSNGEVQASIPGLAKLAGISIQDCEASLEVLSGPDPYSRTPDHEGRRISAIRGGWRLLNHGHYRQLLSAEERREYNRKKQAEWREKNAAKRQENVNDVSMTVNHNKQCQHITDADIRVQISDTDILLPLIPPASGQCEKKKNIPQSDTAKRLAAIFKRKPTTPWTAGELRAFRNIGTIDDDDLSALERYYAANWPPCRDKNILRHDLQTLLNNFPGEVDRARLNAPDAPKTRTNGPTGWRETLLGISPQAKATEWHMLTDLTKAEIIAAMKEKQ
jgi:hypothetical protein